MAYIVPFEAGRTVSVTTQLTVARKCLEQFVTHSVRRTQQIVLVSCVALVTSHIASHTQAGAFAPHGAVTSLTFQLGVEAKPVVPLSDREPQTPPFQSLPNAKQAGLLEAMVLVVTEEAWPRADTPYVLRCNPGQV